MMQQNLTWAQIEALYPESVRLHNQAAAKDQEEGAWLEKRRGKFTASEAFKLFTAKCEPSYSDTANSYIFEKVAERLGAVAPPLNTNELDWGKEQEPFAIEAFERATGWQVSKSDFIDKGSFGATPDGLVGDMALMQAKCPFKSAIHTKYLTYKTATEVQKNIPHYYIQCVMELLVTEREVNYFVSFDPRLLEQYRLHYIEIGRDEVFIKKLVQRLKDAEERALDILEKIKKRGTLRLE
jgi:predicted phage-related endonuclease